MEEIVVNREGDAIVKSALQMPLETEAIRRARAEVMESMLITTETYVEPDKPSITIGGVGAFPLCNVSAVKAKQKMGKTTALTVIVSAVLSGMCFRVESSLVEPTVLWMDTEQSNYDSKLIIERIRQLSGLSDEYINEHFKLLNVRRLDSEERLTYLKEAISVFRPQMVIIDGVVDLADDFNDLYVSKNVISELLRLSSEHRLAIVAVLHTNKSESDHAMRGHLGTMLSQKASTVLECEKDENVITVKCTDYRHAQLPTFSLRYDDDGRICEGDQAYAELQERKAAQVEAEREERRERRKAEYDRQRAEAQERKSEELDERKNVILEILSNNGGLMTRKDLVSHGMAQLNKSYSTVYGTVNAMVKDNMIIETASGMLTIPT